MVVTGLVILSWKLIGKNDVILFNYSTSTHGCPLSSGGLCCQSAWTGRRKHGMAGSKWLKINGSDFHEIWWSWPADVPFKALRLAIGVFNLLMFCSALCKSVPHSLLRHTLLKKGMEDIMFGIIFCPQRVKKTVSWFTANLSCEHDVFAEKKCIVKHNSLLLLLCLAFFCGLSRGGYTTHWGSSKMSDTAILIQ